MVFSTRDIPMYSSICMCGRAVTSANVNVCPFCKDDLSDFSEEACSKHLKKCALKTNPIKCGSGKVGRPSKKSLPQIDYLREDLPRSHRSCINCGRCDCPKKGETCADWIVQNIRACPFCGRAAQTRVYAGVVHGISCGYCNLHMDAYDVSRGDEALIDRWNGGLLRDMTGSGEK